ncbi:MAG: hypothetical protein JWN64_199 [Parcubacteria group bacterium]|nr:hypothetical protein [Parcubacteria group bacterium]
MSGGGHGPSSPLPFFDKIDGFFHGAHEQGVAFSAKPFLIAFPILILIFFFISPAQSIRNFELAFFLAPIWMPLILVTFAWERWVDTNRLGYIAKQKNVLLELRIPRDVRKSPLAMETFFTNLHIGPGESTWYKRLVQGQVRPWWSLEIVSLGGRVHFYIWTREGYRRAVESALYAQYPELEVIEAIDYTLMTDPTHAPMQMWGCEHILRSEDAKPIKTYPSFMKPDAPLSKPEEQIDSLSQIIETLGGIGPKEQFWVQILFRLSKNEKYAGRKTSDGKKYTIESEAGEIIDSIRQGAVKKSTYTDPLTGKVIETEGFPNPTKGQIEGIAAIENKVYRPIFDVAIRSIYTAPEGSFQGTMVSQLIGLWRNMEGFNGFKTARWDSIFGDYPWEDKKGHHRAHLQHQLVDAFRRRSHFHVPYVLPYFMLNAEELATLFHIPSAGVAAPSLARIPSATKEAPTNLPT